MHGADENRCTWLATGDLVCSCRPNNDDVTEAKLAIERFVPVDAQTFQKEIARQLAQRKFMSDVDMARKLVR